SRFAILGCMPSTSDRIFKLLRSLARALFNPGSTAPPKGGAGTRPGTGKGGRPGAKPGGRGGSRPGGRPASNTTTTGLSAPYPGDFSGTSTVTYARSEE